mmetsp:Transcript_115613/g.274782  ORF Transcript_115613/g.274782 Transcript_115613/m.274782 type:complete len:215 (+) Transcript_115613:1360-2004(+)
MCLQEESDFHLVVELLLWWWVSALLPQLDLQILGFFRLRFQDLLHLLTVVDLRRLVDVTVEPGALAYLSMMIQLAPTVLVIASKSIQHLLHSEVALQLLHRTLEIASYEVTLCLLQHCPPMHLPVVGVLVGLELFSQFLHEILNASHLGCIHPFGDSLPEFVHVAWHIGGSSRMEGALENVLLLRKDALSESEHFVRPQDVEFLPVAHAHHLQG